uniref:NADH-ubiquinone oxidoreductase chain 4L n=1 Tax=Cimbex luteus TaxID=1384799 RepID=A0A7T1FUL8_9HYME|nr:NADH dehydrogenase subunit 4L [Cimbex luteus]QPM99423.2 NADH dehydrogenase subunit 4L [Cimbex luteus]UXW64286.1 NADH dehydrogenase subunit 4L [Cimbex luteus]
MFDMLNFLNLIYLIFFIGMLSFSMKRYYLLMILLSLEFVMILLFFLMIMYLSFYGMELYFSMIFLVFSVCESVLGLSILILMIRFNGNDYFQVLSLLN